MLPGCVPLDNEQITGWSLLNLGAPASVSPNASPDASRQPEPQASPGFRAISTSINGSSCPGHRGVRRARNNERGELVYGPEPLSAPRDDGQASRRPPNQDRDGR